MTRRFRMVDMCKGKRKLWLQGTDDVLVVGLHMVGKRTWHPSFQKFHLSTTWHPSLHFIFVFFHLIHPSHIFIATSSFSFSSFFFHSFILTLFFFPYFSIFFFLSFPYSYFSLYFSLSWQLFKSLNSSISRMHRIWNFK
jgi:hypothetical protein